MTRLALICSEPLRPRMAGIGIRYLELARRLPRPGLEVVLFTPGEVREVPPVECEVRHLHRGRLAEALADCDAAVAQGQLANDLLLEVPSLPAAVDLYDPWLVENLHYAPSLGLEPYRNDHATWVLQLSRGDFFLCSSEEQRLFYLGFLTALGRVNPELQSRDPDLDRLIAAVPFGVPSEVAAHRPLLPARKAGERRILFGGLYDWYDPWTLLSALERLEDPAWRLLLIRNPNPASTPQSLLAEVELWCRRRGWWAERVQLLDWVPAERRYDLLREVDLMAAPHLESLETRLSLRTRFLDALAVGCPVVVTAGGPLGRLIEQRGAGWVVAAEDIDSLAAALEAVLRGGEDVERRRAAGRSLAGEFEWERVLRPLLRFATAPWQDATKERFACRLSTPSAPEPLRFRLRRRWRRIRAGRVFR